LALCFVFAVIFLVQSFVNKPWSTEFASKMFTEITPVMGTFAIAIGISTFVNYHMAKMRRKVEGWRYSTVALVAMFAMGAIGIFGGIDTGSLSEKLFLSVFSPMQGAMFSLLAFFMASAAYRAFRARTFEATLLLLAGVIVMLGRVPIGDYLTGGSASVVTEWLLKVPNMASKRAILLGVSLGMVATSLKIMVGIERSWLGGGD
jgi:hypothetical protein